MVASGTCLPWLISLPLDWYHLWLSLLPALCPAPRCHEEGEGDGPTVSYDPAVDTPVHSPEARPSPGSPTPPPRGCHVLKAGPLLRMRRQPDGAAQPADAPLQEAAFVPTQDTSDGHPASVPAAWMECPLPPRSSALPWPPSCQQRPPWAWTPRAQPPESRGARLPGHPDYGRQQLGDAERHTEPRGAHVLTRKPELR